MEIVAMSLKHTSSSLKMINEQLDKCDEQLQNIYPDQKNDYLDHIINYKKSLTQKYNWVKYRFKYMIGINRANRNNPYKDIRKSFLNK